MTNEAVAWVMRRHSSETNLAILSGSICATD